MIIDKRKEKQQELIDCIIQNKYSGIFVASPRFGKTYCLLKALEPIKHLKILVIVPFDTIRQSWEHEIVKWGYKGSLDIIIRNSLKTVDLTSYNLIVKDECHLLADSEITLLKQAKKPILAITGTLGKKAKEKWLYQLGLKEKFRYDVNDAVEDNIVSGYKVYLHKCFLDNTEKKIPVGNKLYTERMAYNSYTASMEYFADSYQRKMYYAGKRARLLYNSTNKLIKAKELVGKAKRVLVFTALTDIANKLCRKVVHSKGRNNAETLDGFKRSKFNKVAAVSMIDMGVTILNLKHAIIHQLNSVEERAIQRILRVMNYEGNKDARIDIIYIPDTVDEEWINKALAFVPEEKIIYVN